MCNSYASNYKKLFPVDSFLTLSLPVLLVWHHLHTIPEACADVGAGMSARLCYSGRTSVVTSTYLSLQSLDVDV